MDTDFVGRHKQIRPEMKMYYEWPSMIEQGVEAGLVPLKFEGEDQRN